MAPITDGTCKFIVTKSGGEVLPGTVTAFSGTVEDGYPIDKNTGRVDKEWHLCDGTNGTPDLRNRFIYGGDGTNNGATGGETSVTLKEENIPAHRHKQNINGSGQDRWDNSFGQMVTLPASKGSQGAEGYPSAVSKWTTGANAVYTAYSGGNQPHNNMPPYYVLAFIMKL